LFNSNVNLPRRAKSVRERIKLSYNKNYLTKTAFHPQKREKGHFKKRSVRKQGPKLSDIVQEKSQTTSICSCTAKINDQMTLENDKQDKKDTTCDKVMIKITKETKKDEKQQEKSAKRRQLLIGLEISRTIKLKI